MSWKVFYFQYKPSHSPIKEFIDRQDIKTQTRIEQSINLLKVNGPFLKPPFIKKLQNKLYELRIQGQASIRIFYTIKKNTYYLLHAFKKKSQKIPLRDLKVAIDRMKNLI